MKLFFILSLVLFAFQSQAKDLNGASFPETVNVGRATLSLNGLGMRTATMFKVKVYAAGLYLAQKSNDPATILASQWPMQLQMEFFRSVSAKDVREAWDKSFKENCGEKCKAFEGSIGELKKLMKDMQTKERMTYTFQESGVEVAFDGKKAGEVAGADFSRFLLSTWLGKNPPNESLKTGLLGLE